MTLLRLYGLKYQKDAAAIFRTPGEKEKEEFEPHLKIHEHRGKLCFSLRVENETILSDLQLPEASYYEVLWKI